MDKPEVTDTQEVQKPESQKVEMPDAYIRTFSGDIDIFQRGGTPGLAPFHPKKTEVESAPEKKLVENKTKESLGTPEEEMSLPEPEPEPELELELEPEKEQTPIVVPLPPVVPAPIPAERLIEASPVEELPIFPVKIPEKDIPKPIVVTPTEKPFEATPIETYAADFQNRVKDTQASTATILAAEQDAVVTPLASSQEVSKKDHKNIWYGAAGLILLLVGSIGIYSTYSQYRVATVPVAVTPSVTTIIVVDEQTSISETGKNIQLAVEQAIKKPLAMNGVRAISLGTATSSVDLLTALSVSAPLILTRNIDTAGSMFGVVKTVSGQSPFFIFSVSAYSSTFSGMLSWEPSMTKALGAFFPETVLMSAVSTTTATTTASTGTTTMSMSSATTTIAVREQAGFRDEVVNNHDVRVYRDTQGNSVLLYGYWNQTTLVVAHDPEAFTEILGRLATAPAQQ